METWDAITSRRNVRSFQDRAIAGADLDRILEAGRRAPSSKNWQPWDFVVVTGREQLGRLAGVWQFGAHIADAAAAIALVVPAGLAARDREIAEYDLGQATMQMMIAAADLGIGTGTRRSPSRTSRATCSDSPGTASPPTCSTSAIPPTGR
jgi:nitroreductase